MTLDHWLIKDQGGLGNCRISPFLLYLDHTEILALMTADLYISVTSTTKSKPWCYPPPCPALSLLNTLTLKTQSKASPPEKPSLILQLADWILLLSGIQAMCFCVLLFLEDCQLPKGKLQAKVTFLVHHEAAQHLTHTS